MKKFNVTSNPDKVYTVVYSKQARKDIKRIINNATKIEILRNFIKKLEEDKPLPENSWPHPLDHQYKDCMECHMQGDFLLIWRDPINKIIQIVRIGSHSELFDM